MIKDVQNTLDKRNIALQKVGVKNVETLLNIERKGLKAPQRVYAKAKMSVYLPSNYKGTHMSRFIEILEEYRKKDLIGVDIKKMLAYSSIENMGILAIGTALGGIAYYAVILHLIGHSLSKASFFLTSGNILELFESKRTKSVKGLIKADPKTGWLWVVSFLAICAFPTSVLFISEFLMIKTMLNQSHYILCALFALLLTIILFGIGKVVINMAFGEESKDKEEIVKENKNKLCCCMYTPQVIMLIIVFVLGIYIPPFLNTLINNTLAGF